MGTVGPPPRPLQGPAVESAAFANARGDRAGRLLKGTQGRPQHAALSCPQWPFVQLKRSKPSGFRPSRKYRIFDRFWSDTPLRGEPYLGLTATEVGNAPVTRYEARAHGEGTGEHRHVDYSQSYYELIPLVTDGEDVPALRRRWCPGRHVEASCTRARGPTPGGCCGGRCCLGGYWASRAQWRPTQARTPSGRRCLSKGTAGAASRTREATSRGAGHAWLRARHAIHAHRAGRGVRRSCPDVSRRPTRVDLYYGSHRDALEWGRQRVRVLVVPPGASRLDRLPSLVRGVAWAVDTVKHALF